jgi:6-phosphogluconolactonase
MKKLIQAAAIAAAFATTAVSAATFVYVSAAEDGEILTYALQPDGTLQAGPRVKADKLVMPMTVSPDKKRLYAALRSKPFAVAVYGIDGKSGGLAPIGKAPLAESFPYISLDRTGKTLFGASYGGHLVSANALGKDGLPTAAAPQVIPTARNAHSIIIDKTNRWVFVPHLGTDQIFQFKFDAKTGKLASNTPAVVQMKQGTGPRHIILSADNRFAYLLSEMVATVTTLSLDPKTGLLTEVSVANLLPADSKLVPGVPRGAVGGPGANQAPRDTANDIWASDLHLTPDGRFLYAAERTGNQIGGFSVDGAMGKLTPLGATTQTEPQPRGFAIDPSGKYMVVSGEKSETISVYAIEPGGALRFLQKYPSGKGSNWVEIVRFD